MAEDQPSQSIFGNLTVVVIAVLLAVTATRSLDVRNNRPSEASTGPGPGSSGTLVQAQLWQDPFEAVDLHLRLHQAGPAEVGIHPSPSLSLQVWSPEKSQILTDTSNGPTVSLQPTSDLQNLWVAATTNGITESGAMALGSNSSVTTVGPGQNPGEDNSSQGCPANTQPSIAGGDKAAVIGCCPKLKPSLYTDCIQEASAKNKYFAVLVDGSSTVNSSEQRRRFRYGLISSLLMHGYKAEHPGNINLTEIGLLCPTNPYKPPEKPHLSSGVAARFDPRDQLPDAFKTYPYLSCGSWLSEQSLKTKLPCTPDNEHGCVPYETFKLDPGVEHDRRAPEEISVLWLRDDLIFPEGEAASGGPRGLWRLISLASYLYPSKLYAQSALDVFGPQKSESLYQLLGDVSNSQSWALTSGLACDDDLTETKAQEKPSNETTRTCAAGAFRSVAGHPGVHIFDFSATKELPFERSDAISFYSNPSEGLKFRFPECSPPNQTFCFTRSGAPDYSLSRQLVSELQRRGLASGASQIILIEEASSDFAKSIATNIEDDLLDNTGPDSSLSSQDIHIHQYLPGVDGHLNTEFVAKGKNAQLGQEDQSTNNEAKGSPASILAPRAEGPIQLDYIRRLGDSIANEYDAKPVGAIGVIGGDIYDKLFIIQTLRPLFPNSLFFTTNLAAELSDEDVLPKTRGLLVASNFGLHAPNLNPGFFDSPFFRDDLETSMFLLSSFAIECDETKFEVDSTDHSCQRLRLATDPKASPSLFQIGQSGTPYQLNNRARAKLEPISVGLSNGQRGLLALLGAGAIFSASFVVAIASGLTANAALRGLIPWSRFRRTGWLSYTLTAILIFAMVFWPTVSSYLTEKGQGEPLGWADGLSLWPSVWLLLICCITTGWSILLVMTLLVQNSISLATNFYLGDAAEVKQRLLYHEFHLGRDFLSTRPASKNSSSRLKIASYWEHCYLGRAAVVSRVIRSLAYSAILGLAILALGMFDHANPLGARGSLVSMVYQISSTLCLALIVFLSSLVFDATVNSSQFVKKARSNFSVWPVGIYGEVADELGFGALRANVPPRSDQTKSTLSFGLEGPNPSLSNWIDIKFTAARTSVILRLVWFPFLSISGLVGAKLLARRDFSGSLIISLAAISLLLIGCVVALRIEAEKQRRDAVDELNEDISKCSKYNRDSTLPPREDDVSLDVAPTIDQLKLMLKRIEGLQEGAFASAMAQPVFKAVLVPITAGALPLIQQFLQR